MYLKTFVYFIRPAQRLCGGTGHIPTPEGAFVVVNLLILSATGQGSSLGKVKSKIVEYNVYVSCFC
jgi:hypothetical protein